MWLLYIFIIYINSIMTEKSEKEVVAQEWIVRFDGKIIRQEKKLIIKEKKDEK